MREYKMRRGEHLEDRVPDMEAFVEEYFGEVTDTEEYEGNDLLVVDDPDNPVFDRVVAGRVEYGSKKDKIALHIDERPAEDVIAEATSMRPRTPSLSRTISWRRRPTATRRHDATH